jgi:glycosyltransferase involved in cell wall biosynthesis
LSVATTRLCIVNPFQHGGGAEFQIAQLIAVLNRTQRFEVCYLTRHIEPSLHPQGYTVVQIGNDGRVPRFGYVTDLLPLYRALREIKPHVIYQRVAGGYTGICALYAQRQRTPMIWHVAHNTDVMPQTLDVGRNLLRRRLEKASIEFAIPRVQRIVAQTQDQSELLQEYYHRQADAVIGNFHPEPAEQIDKSGAPTVVWIANLKGWKQPEVFVRLARSLSDLTGVKFIMIGEAPAAQDGKWAQVLMHDIETTPNLEFVGHRSQDEVNQALAQASIFVNTSTHEGFPNTFIQAWLREAVVVSLAVNPDHVLDIKKVGVHAQTEAALSEAVRDLLVDQSKRAAYAQRARAHARENHSLRNAERLLEMIDACAAT